MREKVRFDVLLHKKYPHFSKRAIQQFIREGKASCSEEIVTKPGHMLHEAASVSLSNACQFPYVSRGGIKLEAALTFWHIDVTNRVCLDAGISTGGFTDCLLQGGAAHVYGIDVGHGQTHPRIAHHPRVTVYERKNIREEMQLPQLVDVVTLDLSFISVLKVIATVATVMNANAFLIVLIKPQFELQPHCIAKGGIVKDPMLRKHAVETVVQGIIEYGFVLQGTMPSPITGGDGNTEFFAYFKKNELHYKGK